MLTIWQRYESYRNANQNYSEAIAKLRGIENEFKLEISCRFVLSSKPLGFMQHPSLTLLNSIHLRERNHKPWRFRANWQHHGEYAAFTVHSYRYWASFPERTLWLKRNQNDCLDQWHAFIIIEESKSRNIVVTCFNPKSFQGDNRITSLLKGRRLWFDYESVWNWIWCYSIPLGLISMGVWL